MVPVTWPTRTPSPSLPFKASIQFHSFCMGRNGSWDFSETHREKRHRATMEICASEDRGKCISFPNPLHYHGSSSHWLTFKTVNKQNGICKMLWVLGGWKASCRVWHHWNELCFSWRANLNISHARRDADRACYNSKNFQIDDKLLKGAPAITNV